MTFFGPFSFCTSVWPLTDIAPAFTWKWLLWVLHSLPVYYSGLYVILLQMFCRLILFMAAWTGTICGCWMLENGEEWYYGFNWIIFSGVGVDHASCDQGRTMLPVTCRNFDATIILDLWVSQFLQLWESTFWNYRMCNMFSSSYTLEVWLLKFIELEGKIDL